MEDWTTISTIVQAASTAILVFITAYYAWATKKMVDEMRKTLEIENLPNISIGIEKFDFVEGYQSIFTSGEFPSVQNVGKGTAFNFEIEMTYDGIEHPEKEVRSTLSPNETFAIGYEWYAIDGDHKFSELKTNFKIRYTTSLGTVVEKSIVLDKPRVFHYGDNMQGPGDFHWKLINRLEKIETALNKLSKKE